MHFKDGNMLNGNIWKNILKCQDFSLFGLYDSKNKRYYKFNHWSESVLAYKNKVQKKYQPPDDYYQFLKELPYATDSKYIDKLKSIENRLP